MLTNLACIYNHDYCTIQVDMQTFLSMTNTDLEEVGITDAEEKLSILDTIVEIKVSIKLILPERVVFLELSSSDLC